MKKLRLLMAFCALLLGWSNASAQTAWTGDITNADGLSFTTKYADPSNHDVAETWTNASSPTHAFDVNQSLTSVPDGVYELSVQAMYRASLTYGTTTNCVLYATVGETTFSTPIANFADYTANEDRAQIGTQMQNNNAYLNVVPAVMVEGGNVKIGMKNIGELAFCTNGYWFVYKKSTFTFKNVTATYHAKLVARATTMLATAPESSAKTTLSNALTTYADATYANVKALQTAINTFLTTATETNPLNVTDYIKNPSFSDDSGNKKNWIQDLGYKQPSDIYQPTGWNMLYSSAKVNNTAYQTYKTQTDGAKDNNCYYVRHRWGDVYAKVSLHQLVKELPAGKYQLNVAVKGGSSVTDPNSLSMTAGSKSGTTEVSDFDKSNYKDYSVQVTKLNADDDIDISFGWDQKSGDEQLYYVDDFRMYYLGDPVAALKKELEDLQATIDDDYLDNVTYINVVGTERTNLNTQKTATAAEETVDAYQTVIDNVNAAIDAFTAAKTNYDALVREIAKAKALGIDAAIADGYAATSSSTAASALTNTQNLKVAEYTYVTTTYPYAVALGEWTSTAENTADADKTDEHWSGETHSYKNQRDSWGNPKEGYAAGSWSINFNQNVLLPAGTYVFKVAGRQASGNQVTTSLVVKKGEDELGSVNDFPRSNNSRGINKSGETDFEGDNSEFANNGAGFGWEWRYVKFTLAEESTVNIAINAVATDYNQWVSFGDYTLQADNDDVADILAYNIAKTNAISARDDAQYVNVTGSERTALVNAINADPTSDYSAATTALDNARVAFTNAKTSYDTYVAAKAVEYEDNLPYASATKFAAIATAQGASDATSASDAEAKTNAILSAYRLYVESNALAEGIGGIDKTNLISDANMETTYDGTNHKFGAWQVIGQTSGTIQLLSGESFTDGSGKNDYKYADIYKNDNNAGIQQTISLTPGKYLLTVTARGKVIDGATFKLFAGTNNVEIPRVGNAGGTFNRGWNDVSLEFTVTETSDVNIGVQSGNGKDLWWSATRFRLAKIGDVVKLNGEGYATYSANYAVEVSGAEAYTAELDFENSKITCTKIATNKVPAGNGVLLYGDANADVTLSITSDAAALGANNLKATTQADGTLATKGGNSYYALSGNTFKLFESDAFVHNKAYFEVESGAVLARSMSIVFDGNITGVANVEAAAEAKAKEGKFIENGKLVIVKNGVKYNAAGAKLY